MPVTLEVTELDELYTFAKKNRYYLITASANMP